MIKKYIKRTYYLERIRPFMKKDVIKVLVGQRRVGKSYLLLQIMDELVRQDIKKVTFSILTRNCMSLMPSEITATYCTM